MMTFEEAEAYVIERVQLRGLTIQPFDGHGRLTHWGDPAAVEVRLASRSGMYYYRVQAFISEPGLAQRINDEMMANGRRHWMKGAFDGGSTRVP